MNKIKTEINEHCKELDYLINTHSTLSNKDIISLQSLLKEDIELLNQEPDTNKIEIKHIQQALDITNTIEHNIQSLPEQPSTLGFFIRNRCLHNRTNRLHELIEIKVPTIILRNELLTLNKILTSKNPVQHFQKFAHLQFISFVEHTGRRGRTYLEITTNNPNKIFLFKNKYGLFLKESTY